MIASNLDSAILLLAGHWELSACEVRHGDEFCTPSSSGQAREPHNPPHDPACFQERGHAESGSLKRCLNGIQRKSALSAQLRNVIPCALAIDYLLTGSAEWQQHGITPLALVDPWVRDVIADQSLSSVSTTLLWRPCFLAASSEAILVPWLIRSWPFDFREKIGVVVYSRLCRQGVTPVRCFRYPF